MTSLATRLPAHVVQAHYFRHLPRAQASQMCWGKSRKKRPMSSSCSGTWEGLALAQRTLGRVKRKNETFSALPFPCFVALSESCARSEIR